MRTILLAALLTATLTGCAPTTGATTSAASFVNKVWEVRSSSSVAPGSLYVFLSDGTLVLTSPGGTPALGTWRSEGEQLVMVEESIPYPTDILELKEDVFRIRSNNPGEPVEITLVPAAR